MSLLIQYLVKLSISLAIVWLFYQFILRRLTFYNSNRWYLLGYTLLAFFIPFINISPIFKSNGSTENGIINLIPSVNQYTIALEEASQCPAPIWSTGYDKWDWTAFALMAGAGILLLRFFIRYISFVRIKNKSKLISADGIKIYQVDDSIIPFSFGNAVFINSNLHTDEELQEIVRHEFVHVRQKHTIDIIWAELLCILNWYNPFAWLLKRSIRQNLEFIADDKVVENGIDKKQYQYLLLKVIGNNQYSIATQFNFSSLKKRIVMMNKLKSARVHMIKFLFVLPLVAILLLAFRKYNATNPLPKINESIIVIDNDTHQPIEGVIVTNLNTSQVKVTDAKGYFSMGLPADKPIHVNMKYNKPGYNEFVTHSFSLEKESNTESIGLVEVVVLKKGNLNVPCVGCNSSVRFEDNSDYQTALNYYKKLMQQLADTIPGITRLNRKEYYIEIVDNKGNCTVVVKDKNKKEVKRLLLTEWNEKADYYENLYGEILSPSIAIVEERIKANNPAITAVTVKGNTATVTLKNGKTEVYTLSIKDQKKAFEMRCGITEEVAIAPTEAITEVSAVTAETMTEPVEERITKTITVPSKASLGTIADDFEITGDKAVMHLKNGKTEEYNLNNPKEKEAFEKKFGKIISLPVEITTAVEPVKVVSEGSEYPVVTTVPAARANEVRVIDNENELAVEEEILFTITKKTTADELESLVNKMKEKGFELKFTNKDYNDGMLTQISGTVKSKDSNSSFSVTDFNKVTVSSYRDGDKIRFKVFIGTKKGIS